MSKFNEKYNKIMNESPKGRKNKNWEKKAIDLAFHFGTTTYKGTDLINLAAVLYNIDKYNVTGRQIEGQIMGAVEEYGTDFSSKDMERKLLGLSTKYPEYVITLTTHDLSSFTITDISKLLAEIENSDIVY